MDVPKADLPGTSFNEGEAMTMTRKIFLSTVLLIFAGACAPGLVSVQSEIGAAYDFRNFGAYHTNRDTRVDVLGATFGVEARAFAQAVTRNMRGHNSGGATNFSTTPGPTAARDLRVVMAFNVAPAAAICKATALSPDGEGGTTLQAAWCYGERVDSYVIARTGTLKGIDDPAFRTLVGQATRELFPTVTDHKINEITDGE